MAARETQLINQGSYGCIYYPSLPFQTSRSIRHKKSQVDENRAKYVSKIQKHNFHSEFEDYIGQKIQEIPSFELFFVPILKTHNIDLARIKQSYVTDCNAISKYMKRNVSNDDRKVTSEDYKELNKKFIIQKMKYINGIYLHRYVLNVMTSTASETHPYTGSDSGDSGDSGDSDDTHTESYLSKSLRKDERQVKKYRLMSKEDEQDTSSFHLLSVVCDLYERINDSIQILIKYNIVHYDLKENNILIENIQQLPYIIDFGLSIDVTRLLEHPWIDKKEREQESSSGAETVINSDVIYRTSSSKIFKDNYLWRQHFYVHAPDYYLWPIEIHIMTYLINENDTLTEESLRKICYEYIRNNKVFAYTSREFNKKIFVMSVATFHHFIHKPREKILNELIKYWDKWDMYANNIMFLKMLHEIVFHIQKIHDDHDDHDDHESQNERRQKILDPQYSSDASIIFKNRFKIKPKQKYNNDKIMNIIQVMLRNIHPNPEKRMTPQETKAFFLSIFYEC